MSALLDLNNNNGHNCLHIAAINGHHALVSYLVESLDLDVDSFDAISGKTALHQCAELGMEYECRLLIALGADVTADSWSFETVADCAARNSHKILASFFVDLGSDLTLDEDVDEDDEESDEEAAWSL